MASLDQIKQVIAKGIEWLRVQQKPNGGYGGWGVGSTSLAIMALLDAGLLPSDPAVANGISYLLNYGPADSTYFRSLPIMALTTIGEKNLDFLSKVQEDTAWLIKSQGSNPGDQLTYGGWGHTAHFQEADGSNTLVALLALHASSLWGLDIPEKIWHRALTWYQNNYELNQDGSCVFRLGNNEQFSNQQVTQAVTAGALAALKSIRLFTEDKQIISQAVELENKIRIWLDSNYLISFNAKEAPGGWYYNYLFNLYKGAEIEPYPILLEDNDWQNNMVRLLVKHQQPDGRWVGEPEQKSTDVVYTSLALLSLSSNIPNKNCHIEQEAFEADLTTEKNVGQELEDEQRDPERNEVICEERNENESHESLEVVAGGTELERDEGSTGNKDFSEKNLMLCETKNYEQPGAVNLELKKRKVKENCIFCSTKMTGPQELSNREVDTKCDSMIRLPAFNSWPSTPFINQANTGSTSSIDTPVNDKEGSNIMASKDLLTFSELDGSGAPDNLTKVNDISLRVSETPKPSVTYFQPTEVVSFHYNDTDTNGKTSDNSMRKNTENRGKSLEIPAPVFGSLICALMLGFVIYRNK